MIKNIKRYGITFKKDTKSGLIFNHFEDSWVTGIKKSTIEKALSFKRQNFTYNLYEIDYVYDSNNEKERINKFLSIVVKKYKSIEYINNKRRNVDFFDMDKQEIFDSTKVYFSKEDLTYTLGYKYKKKINALKERGLINIYNQQLKGFINPQNGEFVYYPSNKYLTFIIPTAKLLKTTSIKEIIKVHEVDNSLKGYYSLINDNLGFNLEVFNSCWDNTFSVSRTEFDVIIKNKYQQYRKQKLQPITYKEYKLSHEYLWYLIQEWNNGDKYERLEIYGIVDSFSGRCHNIHSILPIELIGTGVLNVEVDVKQCQMLIFADLLLDRIGNNSFSQDIIDGIDIYIKIQQHFNLSSRALAKEKMFELLFGSIYSKNFKEFEELWPDAVNEVKRIKMNPSKGLRDFYERKGEKVKKHAELARLLQIREVQLFQAICKELQKKKPNLRYGIRHDGIICSEQSVFIVSNAIKDVLSQLLKVPFEIKVK